MTRIGGVIVVGALEAVGDFILADAGGDGEGADVVGKAALARRDEIRDRCVGAALALGQLLAQTVHHRDRNAARLVGVNLDVVALGIRRPEAESGARGKPALGDDLLQHRLRVFIKRARCLAVFFVVKNGGEFAFQFPGLEERRPVDVVDKLSDRIVRQHLGAEE